MIVGEMTVIAGMMTVIAGVMIAGETITLQGEMSSGGVMIAGETTTLPGEMSSGGVMIAEVTSAGEMITPGAQMTILQGEQITMTEEMIAGVRITGITTTDAQTVEMIVVTIPGKTIVVTLPGILTTGETPAAETTTTTGAQIVAMTIVAMIIVIALPSVPSGGMETAHLLTNRVRHPNKLQEQVRSSRIG